MKHMIVIVDLGTSNIKATVMGEEGRAVSVKTLPTPVFYGKDTMEIDPERLWTTVLDCCRGAVYNIGESVHIDAIALSSMAASFLPLDGEGNVLAPAIGWSDSRSAPYMERYMQEFTAGRCIPGCGQYPLTMYAGFKLQWLAENRPVIFAATRKWLNVSEFIYHRLLADSAYVTDFSLASRTMLLDVAGHCWNPAALSYFSIQPDWLPLPLASGSVVGTAAPATWEAGLSPDTKIVLGGHDHMCAVAGAGITEPGTILNSTGTSEAVECLLPSDGEPEKIAARWLNLECAVLPGRAAAVYYVGATGRVYQSACESLRDYESVEWPVPAAEPIFLPPQRAQQPTVRGKLTRLSAVFDAQHLTRAMRDGMYYECRRGIERMTGRNSGSDMLIRCVGGHTKNRFEMQLKSDATGCAIEISRKEDIASKGAFILAAVGCGWFDSISETSLRLYEKVEKETIYPDPVRSAQYEEIYRSCYLPQFPDGVNSL